MKKTLYKGAYKIVSGLSDLTGGASAVAKLKVALGMAILGMSAGMLTGCQPHTTCYDPVPELMCYDPVAPQPKPETGTEPGTGGVTADNPDLLCYAPALPPDQMQP